MGLFDKKKKSEFDIDEPRDEVVAAVAEVPVAQPAGPPKPMKSDHPDYGIKKAIELMRMLPNDNIELVVRVVKTTLESTNISVASIVKDATRKQGEIEARAETLRKEIVKLESEIATRRAEIGVLDADHKETSMVKERLVLAEKLTSDAGRAEQRSATPTAPPATPPRSPGSTLPPGGTPG